MSAQRTLRSRCLQPFVAAVAPHRFRHLDFTAVYFVSTGASPTGSPTSAPTNIGDTSPPTSLIDPCIYARDGACDVPSRCPVGDWEDCSSAGTQPCIRRPTSSRDARLVQCRSAPLSRSLLARVFIHDVSQMAVSVSFCAAPTSVGERPQITDSNIARIVSNYTSPNGQIAAAALATYGPISEWDTSRIATMQGLFQRQTAFDADLSKWNTASCTNMVSMFAGAAAFRGDIGRWNTASVVDMSSMLGGDTTGMLSSANR